MAQNPTPQAPSITVAITGSTGLVGRHLVAELLRDERYQLRLLVRPGGSKNTPTNSATNTDTTSRIQRQEVSLSNPRALTGALQGVDVVFHCAATVCYDPARDREVITTNTEITSHVALAALESGVGLLVHVSSIATLGAASAPDKPITETDTLNSLEGRSAYSVSKFYAENAVQAATARGLQTVVVNPAIILGEGSWRRGSGQLIRMGMRRIVCCTPGVKGYVDVRDVARALVLLSQTPQAVGERFILSAANLSFGELFGALSKAGGRACCKIHLGKQWLHTVGWLDSVWCRLLRRTPTLTASVIANAVECSRYDGSKITRLTGFTYTPINQTITRLGREYQRTKNR